MITVIPIIVQNSGQAVIHACKVLHKRNKNKH